MPQIFRRRANTLARTGIAVLILVVGGLSLIAAGVMRSPYVTTVGIPRQQPIPYSHKLHVGTLRLDCRYCHTSVESSPFAGLPATETCMNCHSQVGVDNPKLELVRKSYQEGRSIEWTRVNDLPDYVYFDHSIHIHKGVGCITCHGQVDQLAVMVPARAWSMETCLDCHRDPTPYLRPRDQIFAMHAPPPPDQRAAGGQLLKTYKIDSPQKLTNCSICHR
jgi:hypothetical protein